MATRAIAIAIGVAEGGYDRAGENLKNGTRPSRNCNPGDLDRDLIGRAIGTDNECFPIYASDSDGFAALEWQVELWLTGKSIHAKPDSTITQISEFYTTDEPKGAQSDWAANVADVLGVTVTTPISQIEGAANG